MVAELVELWCKIKKLFVFVFKVLQYLRVHEAGSPPKASSARHSLIFDPDVS